MFVSCEKLSPYSPWARYRNLLFGDSDFWIAQYVSFHYLLVWRMNYSAFRDYLRWYIAALWHLLKWACPLQIPNNRLWTPFFGHTEILHMLVSMGSTAFTTAVVLPRYGGLNYACGINEDFKKKMSRCIILYNARVKILKKKKKKQKKKKKKKTKKQQHTRFIYHQIYHGD